MPNPFRNRKTLAWFQFDGPIFQINDEAPFNYIEEFVFLIMITMFALSLTNQK